MNLESAEFFDIVDHRALTDHIYSKVPSDQRYYVFLDEIQRVDGWERSVNALLVDRDADVYITGSNSHLLSSELSTFLTGRYTTVNMLPLSFKEFRELHSDKGMTDAELFWKFLTYGGFPSADPMEGDAFARRNLQDLYSSIVFWDVISRGDVRNTGELNRLITYMMINVGIPSRYAVSLMAWGTSTGRPLRGILIWPSKHTSFIVQTGMIRQEHLYNRIQSTIPLIKVLGICRWDSTFRI